MDMTARTPAASDAAPRLAADMRVMGLIGVAHFFSHFYVLLLPPLFPVLKTVFGVSYTELGLLVTVFSLATGLSQLPFGYLVDWFGARAILIGGLLIESLAFMAMGWLADYWSILALMAVAGVANGVYHPADYAILSDSVSSRRMGRAFSLHTFAGFIGFALAPPVIVYLNAAADWRVGLIACGFAGVLTAGLLMVFARSLRHAPRRGRSGRAGSGQDFADSIRLLLSGPILMCLAFFSLLALASGGINNFIVAALDLRHGVALEGATLALTGYLFGSAAGILVGGFVADRTHRHNLVAALCFLVTAAMIVVIGLFAMPLPLLIALMVAQGVMHGLIMPSRDMIVRSVTPDGAYGKVFGFVTTGFSIGGVIAPLIFGMVLDGSSPEMVFHLIALFMLVSMATVFTSGRRRR